MQQTLREQEVQRRSPRGRQVEAAVPCDGAPPSGLVGCRHRCGGRDLHGDDGRIVEKSSFGGRDALLQSLLIKKWRDLGH